MTVRHYCDYCGGEIPQRFVGGIAVGIDYDIRDESFVACETLAIDGACLQVKVIQNKRSKDTCPVCMKIMINEAIEMLQQKERSHV